VRVHLVDGTYELFRSYFGAPPATDPSGREVGATRGFIRSMLSLLAEPGVTHVACAFDHVIESFRNDLYPGYKTGEGLAPDLMNQFPLAERAAEGLGMVVWPMVEFECDDALAAGASRFADADGVEQVVICTPDKDLKQCIRGTKVVTLDRLRRTVSDEAAVRAKYGIEPRSIPDWLALVGDTADGYPGLPRWGEKSASAVLGRYVRLEAIPDDHRDWECDVRGAMALAASIREQRQDAMLYRTLATLRTDVPLTETLDDLRWRGGRRDVLVPLAAEIGEPDLAQRMPLWRD
jgi:5'-3' exonuclease